jgi:hypothetical protein
LANFGEQQQIQYLARLWKCHRKPYPIVRPW